MSEIVYPAAAEHHRAPLSATVVAAVGIVFGDIGTSPLYAFKQAVAAGGQPTAASVLGILSLIFWALIVVVSLKYALLILRADNHGEGGIMAMLALLNVRDKGASRFRASLLIVGLIGAALLYGDGIITPAISVLSAVEGLKVDTPQLGHMVVPITVLILLGLFLVQRMGTGFIGSIFGPVMLLWFASIGILGIVGIMHAPRVLEALSPHEAIRYVLHAPPIISFAVLGAAFLAVTGGEAMYADMGHFGRRPMRIGWFGLVLPALVLNYFGQGALLLNDPTAVENPFYLLAPRWAHWPLIVFATAATIIASQAIISGAYSLTQQSIQLGFLPRMRVLHTASHERGQIYMPFVNWTLAIGTLAAVITFGSSDALGAAYGIAVSMLMAITTILAALVAIKWGYPPPAVLAVNGLFLVVDLIFVASNMVKLFEGGWFPLMMAALVAFLMLTWRRGAQLLEHARVQLRQPEDEFIQNLIATPPFRLPGTAAVFTAATSGVPLALTHHLKHNRVLHERILLISGLTTDAPFVDPADRVKLIAMGGGLTRILLFFGFMEKPNVVEGLRLACQCTDIEHVDPDALTYYFRRESVIPVPGRSGMSTWRKRLFSAMHLNANRSASYYGVPTRQVVEIGLEVEI